MKAHLVQNDQEWSDYLAFWDVAVNKHEPPIPPSFPVLVISRIEVEQVLFAPYDRKVCHTFFEPADLKRLLGLPT